MAVVDVTPVEPQPVAPSSSAEDVLRVEHIAKRFGPCTVRCRCWRTGRSSAERGREEGKVSIVMILHNYVHVLQACDRVSMIQDGTITFDKPTADTSVEELTDIVVNEYRRARKEAQEESTAG
jgi:hypothetical protein